MIEYQDHLESITANQLSEGFFVGWPTHPSPESHLKILQGSHKIGLALDNSKVVGFINALSDGFFMAYIPLLEVLPEYQGQGIGTELVRRLVAGLDGHYHVSVTCDPDVQPFYSRLDLFSPVSGLVHVDRLHQSA